MAKVKLMQVSTLKCPFPLLLQSEMYLVHHSTSIYHSILQYITVYQSSSIYHSISQNIRISQYITVYQSTLRYITVYQVYQYITVHPPLLQHEMQCITGISRDALYQRPTPRETGSIAFNCRIFSNFFQQTK